MSGYTPTAEEIERGERRLDDGLWATLTENEVRRGLARIRAEEREKAARIAEDTKPLGFYNGFAQWGNDPHTRIAARIREQGEGQNLG